MATTSTRARRSPGRRTTALVAAVLLVGCGVPIPPELPDTTAPRAPATGEVDRLIPEDTRSAELADALRTLAMRIDDARDALLDAAEEAADDGEAEGTESAVGVLLGVPGGGRAPGVLPAIDPDRASTASDDLVTALITLASDTGGERGRLVLELVRDPMLGDLGAWQRDPVGVVAVLRAIAADADATRDARSLDAALLELPGELTRALGYALIVAAAEAAADDGMDAGQRVDADVVAHARTQAVGRLGVVLIALDLAVERMEEGA